MKQFAKILVPVDGSINGCKAVDQAIAIAVRCGAEMDFIYVASNLHENIPSGPIFERIWAKLPDNVNARKHILGGNIPKAILGASLECRSDLIIMGSRGLGLLKGALLGSVSQKVVEESSIPVMVVK